MDRTAAPLIVPASAHRADFTLPGEFAPAADAGVAAGESMRVFAAQIHGSLDPAEVTHYAVNELPPLLPCERVCYLERRGRRFRLIAANGQRRRPARSKQVVSLEQVVDAVASAGRRFVYPSPGVELPEDVGRKLFNYWESSSGQAMLIEPVFAEPAAHEGKHRRRHLVGAVVVEQFKSTVLTSGASQRLDSAVEHFTLALANAKRFSRIYAIPGLSQVGFVWDVLRSCRLAIVAVWAIVVAGLIAAGCWITVPFELECRGRLMPIERRQVFAGIDGEVVAIHVDESSHVEAGETLARLQSRSLEKALLEQTSLLSVKQKSRDAARAELRNGPNRPSREQSTRNQAELEVLSIEIETIQKQIALLEDELNQLDVLAPIAGTITTPRPRDKLIGRPLRQGEAILEIMDESNGWQLELIVPDRQLGHLLTHQETTPDPRVTFRLMSSAQQSYETTVGRLADRTATVPELGAAGLIFCDVSAIELPQRRIGAEVTARIDCGSRSLGYLWFHEFFEMLQRHWWF